MPAPLLALTDIVLTLGGKRLLDGADLVVGEGDLIGLAGRNGSGKSSFLKVAAGAIEADGGRRVARNGLTVATLPQEPDLGRFATVADAAASGLGPADDPYRVPVLLDALGMDGARSTQGLSGGEARRAAIAAALAPDPDILLLDEPTNHLDLPAIEWLEGTLAAARAAIVLISHDRRFLERLTRATVWLDRGTCRRIEQGFGAFETWRDEVIEAEERDAHKLARRIVAEEHWLRYGVTARRKRNERRLAGLHDLRKQYRERRRPAGEVRLAATDAEISGKRVIEAEGISKSYGARRIVDRVSLVVARGERIGIVGANGTGKTTLLKLLTGEVDPDAGTVRHGTNLTTVTLDQKREALDPEATLAETLTRGRGDTVVVGAESRHVVSYMKDFLFAPDQARQPVGSLSGGERGRLMLARALALPANLLVLDEPTNDLDLETLDLLQELLADHPATVLLVSHDRDFLDRVCTSVLFAEGDGRFTEYAGGYSDMIAQRGAGVEARKVPPLPPAPSRARAEPAAPSAPAPRFGAKEKRALEAACERIEALQASAAKLSAILTDPDLYTRDPAAFAKATETLGKVESALAATEEEWLRLEMLKGG